MTTQDERKTPAITDRDKSKNGTYSPRKSPKMYMSKSVLERECTKRNLDTLGSKKLLVARIKANNKIETDQNQDGGSYSPTRPPKMSLSKIVLQRECRKRTLPDAGAKDELVRRIKDYDGKRIAECDSMLGASHSSSAAQDEHSRAPVHPSMTDGCVGGLRLRGISDYLDDSDPNYYHDAQRRSMQDYWLIKSLKETRGMCTAFGLRSTGGRFELAGRLADHIRRVGMEQHQLVPSEDESTSSKGYDNDLDDNKDDDDDDDDTDHGSQGDTSDDRDIQAGKGIFSGAINGPGRTHQHEQENPLGMLKPSTGAGMKDSRAKNDIGFLEACERLADEETPPPGGMSAHRLDVKEEEEEEEEEEEGQVLETIELSEAPQKAFEVVPDQTE